MFSLPGEADTDADADADADGQPKAAGVMQPDPDEKLRFGSLGIPRKMVMTMLRAAEQAEVDPVYLMALADKESSFRPEVKASTSSAQGLFQFIESTWLEIVHDYGSRHGLAWEASLIDTSGEKPMVKSPSDRERRSSTCAATPTVAVMASELMKRDRAQVAFRIGRDLKPAELYLTHFLRPAGRRHAARAAALQAGEGRLEGIPVGGAGQQVDLLRQQAGELQAAQRRRGLWPHRRHDRGSPGALHQRGQLQRPGSTRPPRHPDRRLRTVRRGAVAPGLRMQTNRAQRERFAGEGEQKQPSLP